MARGDRRGLEESEPAVPDERPAETRRNFSTPRRIAGGGSRPAEVARRIAERERMNTRGESIAAEVRPGARAATGL